MEMKAILVPQQQVVASAAAATCAAAALGASPTEVGDAVMVALQHLWRWTTYVPADVVEVASADAGAAAAMSVSLVAGDVCADLLQWLLIEHGVIRGHRPGTGDARRQFDCRAGEHFSKTE